MKEIADPEYFRRLRRERSQLLELLRASKPTQLAPDIPHEQVIPHASYAPWAADEAFLACHALAAPNTLVDRYRCHELWSLVRNTARLPGDLMEIGVWRGGTALVLGMAGDGTPLHLFDTFEGVVGSVPGKDTLYVGGEHADASAGQVAELLARHGVGDVRLHSGISPDATGAACPDAIRLCHIDVDTYGSAQACLAHVWPRVVTGGVVVFDDYGFWGCEGVTRLVNEKAPSDALLVHNLNGHALLVKTGAA